MPSNAEIAADYAVDYTDVMLADLSGVVASGLTQAIYNSFASSLSALSYAQALDALDNPVVTPYTLRHYAGRPPGSFEWNMDRPPFNTSWMFNPTVFFKNQSVTLIPDSDSEPEPLPDLPPLTVTYTGTPYTLEKGQPTSIIASYTGGVPVSWAISPALPTGLRFVPSTGSIRGAPEVLSASVLYSVSATNTGGFAVGTLNVEVVTTEIAPSNIVYSTPAPSYPVDIAIAENTPTFDGTAGTWSLTPTQSFPQGFTFSAETGVIAGTPTNVISGFPATLPLNTNFTISLTNQAGSTSVVLPIEVFGVPTNLKYFINPATYTENIAIAPNTVSSTGYVDSWAAPTPFPTGLGMNTTTGSVTGTPTIVSASTDYTISAINAAGFTTTNLNLTVSAELVPVTSIPSGRPLLSDIARPTVSAGDLVEIDLSLEPWATLVGVVPLGDGTSAITKTLTIGYKIPVGGGAPAATNGQFDPLNHSQFPTWTDIGGNPEPGVRRAIRFIWDGGNSQGVIATPGGAGGAIEVFARQASETQAPHDPVHVGTPTGPIKYRGGDHVGIEWLEFKGFNIHAGNVNHLTVGVNSYYDGWPYTADNLEVGLFDADPNGTAQEQAQHALFGNELWKLNNSVTGSPLVTSDGNPYAYAQKIVDNTPRPLLFWFEDVNFYGTDHATGAIRNFLYGVSMYQTSVVYLRTNWILCKEIREHQTYIRGWALGWEGGAPYMYYEDCYLGYAGSQHSKAVSRPDSKSIEDRGLALGSNEDLSHNAVSPFKDVYASALLLVTAGPLNSTLQGWPFKSHLFGTPYVGDANITLLRCCFEDCNNLPQRGGGNLVYESACVSSLWVEECKMQSGALNYQNWKWKVDSNGNIIPHPVTGQKQPVTSGWPYPGLNSGQDYVQHDANYFQPFLFDELPGTQSHFARGYSPGLGTGAISPYPGCIRTVFLNCDMWSTAHQIQNDPKGLGTPPPFNFAMLRAVDAWGTGAAEQTFEVCSCNVIGQAKFGLAVGASNGLNGLLWKGNNTLATQTRAKQVPTNPHWGYIITDGVSGVPTMTAGGGQNGIPGNDGIHRSAHINGQPFDLYEANGWMPNSFNVSADYYLGTLADQAP